MTEVKCESRSEYRKVRQLFRLKKNNEMLEAAYMLYQEWLINGKVTSDLDSLAADIIEKEK